MNDLGVVWKAWSTEYADIGFGENPHSTSEKRGGGGAIYCGTAHKWALSLVGESMLDIGVWETGEWGCQARMCIYEV